MDDQIFSALRDHLSQHMCWTAGRSAGGCDGTFSRTMAWFTAQGLPIEEQLVWLLKQKVYCDCGVLAIHFANPRRSNDQTVSQPATRARSS